MTTEVQTTLENEKKKSATLHFVEFLRKKDYRRIGNNIYSWNGVYWSRLDSSKIYEIAGKYLEQYMPAMVSDKMIKSCAATAGMILQELKQKKSNNEIVIPCADYVLRLLSDGSLTISEPDQDRDTHTYCLNVYLRKFLPNPELASELQFKDYKIELPELNKSGLFSHYLSTSLPANDVQLTLSQWVGYSLTPIINGETKAVYLLGDGRNGKSVLIDVVSALHYKVTSLKLDKLGPSDLSEMIDATLVFSPDAGKNIQEDNFKALVTGDKIQVKLLYKDPMTFQPKAKFIIAANQLPLGLDKSDGLWRRFIFIDFNQKLEDSQIIADIKDRIIEDELDQVLIWALKGLRSLLLNNMKFHSLECDTILKKQAQLNNNSAWRFLLERSLKHKEDASISKKDVYLNYNDFCISRGEKPMSSSVFWPMLEKAFNREYGIEVNFEGKLKGHNGIRERFVQLVFDSDLPNDHQSKNYKQVFNREVIEINNKRYIVKIDVDFETNLETARLEQV
ncbi:phage/plasmid primase, P4 family [Flavobacterium sp.]|jgi:putative DNA primase/helicase|uniref:DNA primase family protein n=1 Tax=Flavobacterium sp. TaxID=239 RepID=UPI0037BE84B9